jgi:glyoxylase-like metal-dependent hydrolase (beta-lactamase superfamily II)
MDLVEVRGLRGIYLVDTGQFGLEGFGSAYILDGPIAAIVETGLSYSAPRILKALEELGIPTADVGYILATHVHLDHAGGAGPLAQACPNATVAVHERGAKHLIKPAYLVKSVREATGPMFHHYGEAVPIPRERLLELEGGEVISLGGGVQDQSARHPRSRPSSPLLLRGAESGSVRRAMRPGSIGPRPTASSQLPRLLRSTSN